MSALLYAAVDAMARDYAPHHTTPAFWHGVHDQNWRLEVPSRVFVGAKLRAYEAGRAAALRARAELDAQYPGDGPELELAE